MKSELFESVFPLLKLRGRVPLYGLIAYYNQAIKFNENIVKSIENAPQQACVDLLSGNKLGKVTVQIGSIGLEK